jgi:branched-chain amino acid transport system permease protein
MTRLGWIALAAGFAALVLLPLGLRNYGIYLLSLWALYAIAAQGLNLTLGYAGQVSLGQAAFLGIGAYTSAILMKAGLSFWAALPAAAALCFAIGLLLGFPALRVQHHYLAFATLGFNALVYLILRNEEWLTGGTFGIRRIPRPELFGHSFRAPLDFYYLCLAALVAVTVMLWWILRSPWGRAFAALRDNPVRAESLGIDIRAYTLLAFAIGATCAGVAGAFFASLVQFIDPSPFGLGASLAFLLMVVVGGSGRFFGPFLGAALVTLLPEWLRFAESYYLLVYAVLVVILMVYCPGGLLAIPDKLRAQRKTAAATAPGPAPTQASP